MNREQYRDAVQRWRSAMPTCLEPLYEHDLDLRHGFIRDKAPLLQALESAYPSSDDRVVALFSWYGSGKDYWASGSHFIGESIGETLLNMMPLETLIQTVINRDLAPDVIDGAARYFITRRPPLEDLPVGLRLKLLDYCASTGDHAKIACARRALDVELQQLLTSGETDAKLKPLVTAITQFSCQLFSCVWAQGLSDNIMISPYSIALTLSLLYNGVRGESANEIAQAMDVTTLDIEAFNERQYLLQELLSVLDTRVELKVAHSLWVNHPISLACDYMQRVQKHYQAETRSIDFGEESAVQIINHWVEEKTAGGIPRILEQLDPSTLLVLINTVYLKAIWARQFYHEDTKEGSFTLLDGSQKQHPMMTGEVGGNYLRTENFEAVRLAYGNRSVSMDIFLPVPPFTLRDFQNDFSSERWNDWVQQLRENRSFGSVTMPRFKFEYGLELSKTMKSLGISRVFAGEQADFSGMADRLPYPHVGQMQHRTFVEVDEEGTRASAATAIVGAGGKLTPAYDIIINRPFFFAIHDDQTGLILFMGCVVEPF